MRKTIVLLFVLLVLVTGVWAETYTTQPGSEGKDAQITTAAPTWNGGGDVNLLKPWSG